MEVAVLGTGMMGSGMARSLRRAGLHVRAWNRTRSNAMPLADDGVVIADTVAEAVSPADVVITMLFDTRAILGIVDELVGALGAGAVWLQCATVGPDGIAEIASESSSSALVDSPVMGTKEPAEKGTLTVLVSGDQALIERAQPVLGAIGSKTVRVGEKLGGASALKLVGNAWIGAITAATAQSLALSAALGLDEALFLEAVKDTPSDNPYMQAKGSAMRRGDYAPSFSVNGLHKDLDLMLSATKGTDFTTTLLDAIHMLYQRATEAGHGDDDVASVRTVLGG